MERILVAVDDSPAGLQAAHVAVDLAASAKGVLRAVHVLVDGEVAAAFAVAGDDSRLGERRGTAASALLRHVASLARRAGVEVETVRLEGEPARLILAQARQWGAGLVVMGRSGGGGPGRSYVGDQTRHVIEFAEQPVLVVLPAAAPV